MDVSVLFGIIFAVFAVGMIYIGWYTRTWIRDASDFLLAGREVSLLVNVFGIAAIAFAGTTIVFSTGLAVLFGVWASITWGVIIALGGFASYGLIFAPYIRACGAQTLPEWLEMRYNGTVRTIVAVTTIFSLLGLVANNVVAMATVVVGYVDWPLPLTISLIFLLFLVFSYLGGFWAITLTDVLQMILGLVILPLVLISLVSGLGGLSWVGEQVAASGNNIWTAGIGGQSLPIFSFQYPSVLTFAFSFTIFLVWGSNYYWLRVASCRSERVARDSYLWAALLQIVVGVNPYSRTSSQVNSWPSKRVWPRILPEADIQGLSAIFSGCRPPL